MAGRTYGANKVLFEVLEENSGITLVVRTENIEVRDVLNRYASDVTQLLGRQSNYITSSIAAKKWLGHVMHDFERQFRSNRVTVVFR